MQTRRTHHNTVLVWLHVRICAFCTLKPAIVVRMMETILLARQSGFLAPFLCAKFRGEPHSTTLLNLTTLITLACKQALAAFCLAFCSSRAYPKAFHTPSSPRVSITHSVIGNHRCRFLLRCLFSSCPGREVWRTSCWRGPPSADLHRVRMSQS